MFHRTPSPDIMETDTWFGNKTGYFENKRSCEDLFLFLYGNPGNAEIKNYAASAEKYKKVDEKLQLLALGRPVIAVCHNSVVTAGFMGAREGDRPYRFSMKREKNVGWERIYVTLDLLLRPIMEPRIDHLLLHAVNKSKRSVAWTPVAAGRTSISQYSRYVYEDEYGAQGIHHLELFSGEEDLQKLLQRENSHPVAKMYASELLGHTALTTFDGKNTYPIDGGNDVA